MVCQEEKRLFVKKQYERIGLSNGEEFLREEEFLKNWVVRKRRVFFRKKNRSSVLICQKEKSWLRKDN